MLFRSGSQHPPTCAHVGKQISRRRWAAAGCAARHPRCNACRRRWLVRLGFPSQTPNLYRPCVVAGNRRLRVTLVNEVATKNGSPCVRVPRRHPMLFSPPAHVISGDGAVQRRKCTSIPPRSLNKPVGVTLDQIQTVFLRLSASFQTHGLIPPCFLQNGHS